MKIKNVNVEVGDFVVLIESYDEFGDKLKNPNDYKKILFSSDYSPFWNRVLGTIPTELPMTDQQCQDIVKPTLQHWKIGHIHVGHSPQFISKLGVNSTCDNSVWRHDIGLSHAFSSFDKNGRSEIRKIHLLEIINDKEFNILRE